MIGALFTRQLNRLFDKKPAVVWGTSFWAFCQLVPVVAFADAVSGERQAGAAVDARRHQVPAGVGVGQALVSFNSMVADIADENELQPANGRKASSRRCAREQSTSGLGNILAGVALDVIHWPRGAQSRARPTFRRTPSIARHSIGPIVAAFCVICVWCYSHYHLTRERHEQTGCARRRGANERRQSREQHS
jgi:Na+/melibiose symporter-like transporter